MPIFDSSEGSKAPRHSTHESAAGVRMSPGPFIGTVKNNIDPMRTGRLQVFIQELGGNPDDQSSWRTVQYASPFMGVTPPPSVAGQADKRPAGQSFANNPHSYGFWMAPPDLEVNVLCIFVNGDPFKGYWFACLPDWPNTHMVPAIGYSDKVPIPTVEYNGDNEPAAKIIDFWAKQDTEHKIVADQFRKQGLIDDSSRGPISSSMYRESPSYVYGFNTPGRKLSEQWVNCQGTQEPYDKKSKGRRGGHSIVMDDGDQDGNNELMRLRTAQGHQIMMSDSGGFIHVINSEGTAWFELDFAGNINFYANGDFNVKAKGMVKLDGDKGVMISSKASASLYGGQGVKVSSIGAVDIAGVGFVKISSFSDLHLSGTKTHITGKQCTAILGGTHLDLFGKCLSLNSAKVTPASSASLGSAATGLPTHEPWSGHRSCNSGSSTASMQALSAAASALGSVISTNYNNYQTGLQTVSGGSISYGPGGLVGAGGASYAGPPVYFTTVGGSVETTAALNTIKTLESGGNYLALNRDSSASGAYQYLDSTWQTQAKAAGVDVNQYPRAYLAPPEIQDKVAAYNVDTLRSQGVRVDQIPNVWYTGNKDGIMSQRQLDANRGLTSGTYQGRWMNEYQKQLPKAEEAVAQKAAATTEVGYTAPQQQQGVYDTQLQTNAINKEIDSKQAKLDALEEQKGYMTDQEYADAKASLQGDIDNLNAAKANLDYGPPVLPPSTPGEVPAPTTSSPTLVYSGNTDTPDGPPVAGDTSASRDVTNFGSGDVEPARVEVPPVVDQGPPISAVGGGNEFGNNVTPDIQAQINQVTPPNLPSAADVQNQFDRLNQTGSGLNGDRLPGQGTGSATADPVTGFGADNAKGTADAATNANPESPAGPNC